MMSDNWWSCVGMATSFSTSLSLSLSILSLGYHSFNHLSSSSLLLLFSLQFPHSLFLPLSSSISEWPHKRSLLCSPPPSLSPPPLPFSPSPSRYLISLQQACFLSLLYFYSLPFSPSLTLQSFIISTSHFLHLFLCWYNTRINRSIWTNDGKNIDWFLFRSMSETEKDKTPEELVDCGRWEVSQSSNRKYWLSISSSHELTELRYLLVCVIDLEIFFWVLIRKSVLKLNLIEKTSYFV